MRLYLDTQTQAFYNQAWIKFEAFEFERTMNIFYNEQIVFTNLGWVMRSWSRLRLTSHLCPSADRRCPPLAWPQVPSSRHGDCLPRVGEVFLLTDFSVPSEFLSGLIIALDPICKRPSVKYRSRKFSCIVAGTGCRGTCIFDTGKYQIKIKKKWVLASKFKKYGFRTSKLAVYWDRCKGKMILHVNVLSIQRIL